MVSIPENEISDEHRSEALKNTIKAIDGISYIYAALCTRRGDIRFKHKLCNVVENMFNAADYGGYGDRVRQGISNSAKANFRVPEYPDEYPDMPDMDEGTPDVPRTGTVYDWHLLVVKGDRFFAPCPPKDRVRIQKSIIAGAYLRWGKGSIKTKTVSNGIWVKKIK